jgi:hypothetical protein
VTEQTEHEALEALFADLHGTKDSIPLHRYTIKWRDRRDRFTTMLDAGAYLDAAMMLYKEVPDRVPSDPMLAVEEARKQHEAHKNG